MEEENYPYFKSISLTNSRTFDKTQKVTFAQKDGQPSMWNLIIGDNGTGKTTILRSLALLSLGYSIENNIKSLAIAHSLLTRNETSTPKFIYELGTGAKKQRLELSNLAVVHRILNKVENKEQFRLPKIIAYGASRKIGSKALSDEGQSPVDNLFDDNVFLSNAEEWIVQADYSDKRKGNGANSLLQIKTLLLSLFEGEISDIEIRDNKGDIPKVYFQTDYGWVKLHELSLGYKTLVAWMVDFSRHLTRFYPESESPLHEPAVCLIDEIDLHLHPRFQRNLVNFLSKTFPKTQFIVTAHSPLIVQSFADANIILLRKKDNYVEIEKNHTNIKAYRIDQVLTSDLFDVSARELETENLLKERTRILSKEHISPADEKRLQEIQRIIGEEIPTWETKYEKKAMSAIEKIAQMLERKERYDTNSEV